MARTTDINYVGCTVPAFLKGMNISICRATTTFLLPAQYNERALLALSLDNIYS